MVKITVCFTVNSVKLFFQADPGHVFFSFPDICRHMQWLAEKQSALCKWIRKNKSVPTSKYLNFFCAIAYRNNRISGFFCKCYNSWLNFESWPPWTIRPQRAPSRVGAPGPGANDDRASPGAAPSGPLKKARTRTTQPRIH